MSSCDFEPCPTTLPQNYTDTIDYEPQYIASILAIVCIGISLYWFNIQYNRIQKEQHETNFQYFTNEENDDKLLCYLFYNHAFLSTIWRIYYF